MYDLSQSRAFLYGESIFTTMRVSEGKVIFFAEHVKRLHDSMAWMWPSCRPDQWPMIPSVPPGDHGTWRLTISAQQDDPGVLHLTSSFAPLRPAFENIKIDLCELPSRSFSWPSFIKTGDYLQRIVASRHLATDVMPLFIVDGEITECIHANIFLWDGTSFHTPLAGPNVLSGIGRSRFIQLLKQKKIACFERKIKLTEMNQFKSLLSVNAVRGPCPVIQCGQFSLVVNPFTEITDIFFS